MDVTPQTGSVTPVFARGGPNLKPRASGESVLAESSPQAASRGGPEVSVVMPCLNEVASVGVCVTQALEGLSRAGLSGEVVVCDNGSTDGSVEVAEAAGARVVHEAERGYGAAYRRGFAEARGRYIVMGDSDGSYDFTELGRFVHPLQDGFDYVHGSRFAGQILPGSMPWLHRYVGNPVLTGVLNVLFSMKTSDAHCGMRAFTSDAIERMRLISPGMELASEMVIAAAEAGLKVTEVPITYYPRLGESKLRSWPDGWRHLRFMLLRSPRTLFLVPGGVALGVGLVGQVIVIPGRFRIGAHRLDMHVSALLSLLTVSGLEGCVFGLLATMHGRAQGYEPRTGRVTRWVERHSSPRNGLVAGGATFSVGLALDTYVLGKWLHRSRGPLNEMKAALLALSLMTVGVRIVFTSLSLTEIQVIEPSAALAEPVADPSEADPAPALLNGSGSVPTNGVVGFNGVAGLNGVSPHGTDL
jgi:hypothetical protein